MFESPVTAVRELHLDDAIMSAATAPPAVVEAVFSATVASELCVNYVDLAAAMAAR